MAEQGKNEVAIFGGGCFWCVEAVLQRLKGVKSVSSGYSGGHKPDPTYEDVCSGTTGHAEVVRVEFDPTILPYETLLDVFFSSHDPTTLNRQGNDVGDQYRSIVFYTTPEQKIKTEEYIKQLEADKVYADPIVTKIEALDNFYPAENYHQNYYNQNKGQPYCQAVINPKLKKLKERYAKLLKSDTE